MTMLTTTGFALSLALAPSLCSAAAEPPLKDCTAALATADDEIIAFYPPTARASGIEGMATVACRSSSKGMYADCALISEGPLGQDFGRAALEIVDAANAKSQIASTHDLLGVPRPIAFQFLLSPPAIKPNPFRWSITGKINWSGIPTGVDIDAAYRSTSLPRLGVDGNAILSCTVGKDGQLKTCAIASEHPIGAGVGAAALSMSRRFRMRSGTEFGCSSDGIEVQVPVSFRRH